MMNKKLHQQPMILRLILLMAGLFCLGLAIVFQVNAGLGYTPWTVMADGIGKMLGATIGRGEITVSVFIVILDLIARERLGIGTLANMLLVGSFVDLIAGWGIVPVPTSLWIQLSFLLIGTMILGIGCVLYIGVGFGAGPRDSMMVAVMRWSGKSMMFCRLCIEIVVCVVGYFLGGTVGIGTIVLTLITGPMISTAFKIAGIDAKTIPHLCFYPFQKAKESR